MKRTQIVTLTFVFLFVSGMTIVGCKKDSNPVASAAAATAIDDAAESVAGSVGDDNGGATDNMGDALMLSSEAGISTSSLGKSENAQTYNAAYDSTTGWWTGTLNRTKGSFTGLRSASITRVYKYQFLKNADNSASFQKFWRVGTDTARAVNFQIVSGSGSFITPRLKQRMDSVSAQWKITGTNTDTVTINSTAPYTRKGSDTVLTLNAVRTLNHTLTLNFTNIKAPRFKTSPLTARANFAKAYSGTITGQYDATITFQNAKKYNETTVSKSFTITVGGGNGTISLGGNVYHCDIQSGDRN